MTFSQLKYTFAGLSLIILLTFLIVKTRALDLERHIQVTINLTKLRELDATLSQDILKSSRGFLLHYDTLVSTLKEIKRLQHSLVEGAYAISGKGKKEIDRKFEVYTDALMRKEVLIDYFKSDNAIYKNSLTYFPLAIEKLTAFTSEKDKHSGLTPLLQDILNDILSYALFSSEKFRLNILAEIKELLKKEDQLPPVAKHDIDSIVSHARTILKLRGSVDALVKEIISMPSAQYIDELFQTYLMHHEETLRLTNLFRRYLYLFSVVSLACIGYIMLRLRHAARTLRMEISERRKVEDSLKKLTNAIECSAESVVITDLDGSIEYVNPAFEKISGYSNSESMGENMNIVKSGSHDKTFYKDMWDTIKSGKIWQGELTNKKKSGETYQERMSISPVFDNDGNISNFVAIKEDVTEKKKLQQQLFQSEKLSSIGTFISGVAHEINNPLTAVLGYSEMLIDEKNISVDGKERLEIIKTQSQRVSKIVKNLLKYSRENKERKLAANINDVLETTLTLHEYHFESGDVTVIRDFAENLPPVLADVNKLQQVFMNVLQNAFHAMANANIKGEIRIKTNRKNDEIKIIIENDGPLIPEVELNKLFDPFFSTKEVGKGTGLGLYVSLGIMKEHGGKMEAENIENSGVRFNMSLPVTDKITTGNKDEKTKITLPENIKILLVDDEEIIRDFLEKLLTKRGAQVFLAENGKKAIEILKGEEVDVIISDARMPVCSGLELGEWLKNNKPAYLKKFILLTGDINQQINDFCKQNHCCYLRKPIRGNSIIEKVYETVHN